VGGNCVGLDALGVLSLVVGVLRVYEGCSKLAVSSETKGDRFDVGIIGISYADHCGDPFYHIIVDGASSSSSQ
jgi:hypothetical protein